MSATCYSDEYDDVMISGKWFLVFHHCAGIAAPGAPANKATSLLIAYNPLQPVTKNLSKFCHVLIEPGILSQDVPLAALPSSQFPQRSEHLAHDLTNIHQGHVPLTSFKPALKRQFCS